MKRNILLFGLLALLSAGLFAQERIAVFPFEDLDNILSHNEAIMFYREFSNEFTNKSVGKFTVVPRQDVEKLINTEASFQLSDFSAREKTAEMNRVLNGTQILSGVIGRIDNNIRITVSLYTYPELIQLRGGATLSVENKTEIFNKISELVQSMQNAIAGIYRTYNIGDIGPAGGYIFYDKGFISDGWRFLEAAPSDTEFSATWGPYDDIQGTSTVIGSGKRNTQFIIEKLNQLGNKNSAAHLCAGLEYNGYNDWFLPSKDELDLMFKNLKEKNTGGFRKYSYWSSSQTIDIPSCAWYMPFSDYLSGAKLINQHSVRAIRAF